VPVNVKPHRAILEFGGNSNLEVLPEGWGIGPAIFTKCQILLCTYISKWAFDFVSHPQVWGIRDFMVPVLVGVGHNEALVGITFQLY